MVRSFMSPFCLLEFVNPKSGSARADIFIRLISVSCRLNTKAAIAVTHRASTINTCVGLIAVHFAKNLSNLKIP